MKRRWQWKARSRFVDEAKCAAVNEISRVGDHRCGKAEVEHRRFYRDWDPGIFTFIGLFRLHYARHVGEARFESLIRELLAKSSDFAKVWPERQTAAVPPPVLLRLHSGGFGDVNFHSVRLWIPELPDHFMALLTPADDSTRAMLRDWHGKRANESR